MSYVRWGEDGSHVYIYDDVHLGLYCCGCDLKGAVCEKNYDAMLAHIARHRALGDHVPEFVDAELIAERDGEGARLWPKNE